MHPGIRIQMLLAEKGITQRKAAEELHINPNTLNGYIRERRVPDCTTLALIADYLGTNVDYLLGNTHIRTYPACPVSEEEGLLLSNYRAMDVRRRQILLQIAASLHVHSLSDQTEAAPPDGPPQIKS